MAAPRLYRVILVVDDVEHAARFYGELLDLPGTRVSPGRHYFDCRGTILACFDPAADGNPPDRRPEAPNPDYVYFAVDDLESAHGRARQAGARELTEIETQPWGETSFYAKDPFGNPICVVAATTVFTG